MSEMVRKVAKAIRAKVPVGYGMTEAEALEYARVAMREPTVKMTDAGIDANPRGRTLLDTDLTTIHDAMIAAALTTSTRP